MGVSAVANVLHGLAKLQFAADKALLQALLGQLTPAALAEDAGRHLGILFWSLARLKACHCFL